MAKTPLRLLAHDAEDLEIFSVFLQDAVLRVGDMAYMPKSRRFAAVVNRYCWEGEAEEERPCLRTHTGLHFENVMRVRTLNLQQDKPDAVLELLALRFVPGEDGAGSVVFFLAGGAVMRLDVECIDATLVDLAEPRPAKQRPRHDLETGS
jgi:hypothetical protein